MTAVLEYTARTPENFERIARRIEIARDSDSLFMNRETNVAILQATTGKPWYILYHRGTSNPLGVTWDQYGPHETGNPVCSFQDFLGSPADALDLITDEMAPVIIRLDDLWAVKINDAPRGISADGHPNESFARAVSSAVLRYYAARARLDARIAGTG